MTIMAKDLRQNNLTSYDSDTHQKYIVFLLHNIISYYTIIYYSTIYSTIVKFIIM